MMCTVGIERSVQDGGGGACACTCRAAIPDHHRTLDSNSAPDGSQGNMRLRCAEGLLIIAIQARWLPELGALCTAVEEPWGQTALEPRAPLVARLANVAVRSCWCHSVAVSSLCMSCHSYAPPQREWDALGAAIHRCQARLTDVRKRQVRLTQAANALLSPPSNTGHILMCCIGSCVLKTSVMRQTGLQQCQLARLCC
jgi:hypothetical protein